MFIIMLLRKFQLEMKYLTLVEIVFMKVRKLLELQRISETRKYKFTLFYSKMQNLLSRFLLYFRCLNFYKLLRLARQRKRPFSKN